MITIVLCKFHRPTQNFEHYFWMVSHMYYHLAALEVCIVRNGTKFLPVHHVSTSTFPSLFSSQP